jgi:AraC-like DNA-binding protein
MRQPATIADEPHMLVRSLSVNYSPGSAEAHHAHPWPQLLHAKRGTMRAEIGQRIWLLPPGRALWIPAAAMHQLTMLSEVELRTLYLRPDVATPVNAVRVFVVSDLLREAILRICELQWLDARVPTEQLLRDLVLAELAQSTPEAIHLTLPSDPRALRLARRMLDAETTGLDLSATPESYGLSRRTAERIFKTETGMSPARWHRLARLGHGLASLARGDSIDAAAEHAGYQSRSAFSDVFQKTFGFPPGMAR